MKTVIASTVLLALACALPVRDRRAVTYSLRGLGIAAHRAPGLVLFLVTLSAVAARAASVPPVPASLPLRVVSWLAVPSLAAVGVLGPAPAWARRHGLSWPASHAVSAACLTAVLACCALALGVPVDPLGLVGWAAAGAVLTFARDMAGIGAPWAAMVLSGLMGLVTPSPVPGPAGILVAAASAAVLGRLRYGKPRH